MDKEQEIRFSEGRSISYLKFPTKMLRIILGLLDQHNYPVQKIDNNTFDISQPKSFLRRVTPFMLNAFVKFLKGNLQYKEILSTLQNIKKQKESKQHKYELRDIRSLLKQEKGKERICYQAFQTFLMSDYLQEYIQNNKRIDNQITKQLYLKSIQLFLEEIEKKQKIFVKFISDTNAKKIVEYWNEIMYSQNSQNNSFNQVESIPNGEDQTPYLDQEPRKRDILETSSQDHIIFQEDIDFQNLYY